MTYAELMRAVSAVGWSHLIETSPLQTYGRL